MKTTFRSFLFIVTSILITSCGGSGGGDDTPSITTFNGSWLVRGRFSDSSCNNQSDVEIAYTLNITQSGSQVTATTSYDVDNGPITTFTGTVNPAGDGLTMNANANTEDCTGHASVTFANADLDSGHADFIQLTEYSCVFGENGGTARSDFECGTATRIGS